MPADIGTIIAAVVLEIIRANAKKPAERTARERMLLDADIDAQRRLMAQLTGNPDPTRGPDDPNGG